MNRTLFVDDQYTNLSRLLEAGYTEAREAEDDARMSLQRTIRRGKLIVAPLSAIFTLFIAGNIVTPEVSLGGYSAPGLALLVGGAVVIETVRRVRPHDAEMQASRDIALEIAETQRWVDDQTDHVYPAWAAESSELPLPVGDAVTRKPAVYITPRD